MTAREITDRLEMLVGSKVIVSIIGDPGVGRRGKLVAGADFDIWHVKLDRGGEFGFLSRQVHAIYGVNVWLKSDSEDEWTVTKKVLAADKVNLAELERIGRDMADMAAEVEASGYWNSVAGKLERLIGRPVYVCIDDPRQEYYGVLLHDGRHGDWLLTKPGSMGEDVTYGFLASGVISIQANVIRLKDEPTVGEDEPDEAASRKARRLRKAMIEMVNGSDFQVIGDGISEWYMTLQCAVDVAGCKNYNQWVLLDSDGLPTIIYLEQIQSINVERHKIFILD